MLIEIEPLAREHNRSNFNCGVDALNEFLKKYSAQNQRSNISRTFVAIDTEEAAIIDDKKDILGFYTLSTGQINVHALPDNIKHPRYPVSIARIARLAVNLQAQGNGIGGLLLYNAIQKIKTIAQVIGIFAIVVDAKDNSAKSFYTHYGFIPLQDNALTLCLPMKTLDYL